MATLTDLHLITSDDVTLVGQLATPTSTPRALMVVCHPHPLRGGSMDAPVVDALFRQLPEQQVATLRFNFRGVEGSGGLHDHGIAERLDVDAAIDDLGNRWPDVPLIVAGWSFGADVSLAVSNPRHSGWFAVAPPLRIVPVSEMVASSDPRPKTLVIPEHDQFNPPEEAARTTADWTNSSQSVVPGADHFLAGGVARVVALALGALS